MIKKGQTYGKTSHLPTTWEMLDLPQEWREFREPGKIMTKEEYRELKKHKLPPKGYRWWSHPASTGKGMTLVKIVKK